MVIVMELDPNAVSAGTTAGAQSGAENDDTKLTLSTHTEQ